MSANLTGKTLADMQGLRIGHWTGKTEKTGCTAIIFDESSTASVHISGGAPGSQETDLLEPSRLVSGIDAILLTGGSAFGLAAASGVRKYLEEKGRGFNAAGHKIPIVPAAVIFDLSESGGAMRPGPDEGYAACVNSEKPYGPEGRVGVGTGATVGKYLGVEKRSPGGLASRLVEIEGGVTVGVIMVANCYGAVISPSTGEIIAGPKNSKGDFVHYLETEVEPPTFGNTAIGAVVTDAKFNKAELSRIAVMAQDGLARSVSPSHTPYDGDMIFAVSTGGKKGDVCRIGAFAAKLVEECIVAAAGGKIK